MRGHGDHRDLMVMHAGFRISDDARGSKPSISGICTSIREFRRQIIGHGFDQFGPDELRGGGQGIGCFFHIYGVVWKGKAHNPPRGGIDQGATGTQSGVTCCRVAKTRSKEVWRDIRPRALAKDESTSRAGF